MNLLNYFYDWVPPTDSGRRLLGRPWEQRMNRRRLGYVGALTAGAAALGRYGYKWYADPKRRKAIRKSRLDKARLYSLARTGGTIPRNLRWKDTGKVWNYYDYTTSQSCASTGNVIASVFLITQGDDVQYRTGNRIWVKKLQYHFFLQRSANADLKNNMQAITPNYVRVIIFLDTQCNGAAAGVTDVLDSADWQEFNNIDNSRRFKVLRNIMMRQDITPVYYGTTDYISGNAATSVARGVINMNLPIDYSAAGGAIGNIRSNNIGILVISKEAGSGDTLYVRTRCRFTD